MRTDRLSSQRSGTVDRIGDGLSFDTPPDQMEKYVGAPSATARPNIGYWRVWRWATG